MWKVINEDCPYDQIIDTCIIENGKVRMQQRLIRSGNLFFYSDKSMYVYYTPTHWRYL